MGFAPGMMPAFEPLLQAGFDRAGNGKGIDDFDIWAIVDVLVTDDVREGFDLFREYVVEYAELMRNQMEVLGYPGLCDRLGELVASGRRAEALAEVPDDYVDHSFLIGPLQRIAHRLVPWLESGASGLIFRYGPQVRVGKGSPAEDRRVYEVIADVAGELRELADMWRRLVSLRAHAGPGIARCWRRIRRAGWQRLHQ